MGVVALQHALGSTQARGDQSPALEQVGFRVLAYDHWRCGRSSPGPDFPWDHPGRETEDRQDLLTLLGIQSAQIMKRSHGREIALLLAAGYPQALQRMAVVAAPICNEPTGRAWLAATLVRCPSDTEPCPNLAIIHGTKAQRLVRNWLGCWLDPQFRALDLGHSAADPGSCSSDPLSRLSSSTPPGRGAGV